MAVREVFMSSKRYTEEFKIEVVRQVIDRGHRVAEVAGRLIMTTHNIGLEDEIRTERGRAREEEIV